MQRSDFQEEMKEMLKIQCEEKKRKKQEKFDYDNNFNNTLVESRRNYQNELEEINIEKRRKVQTYRDELEKQKQENIKYRKMVDATQNEVNNKILIELSRSDILGTHTKSIPNVNVNEMVD